MRGSEAGPSDELSASGRRGPGWACVVQSDTGDGGAAEGAAEKPPPPQAAGAQASRCRFPPGALLRAVRRVSAASWPPRPPRTAPAGLRGAAGLGKSLHCPCPPVRRCITDRLTRVKAAGPSLPQQGSGWLRWLSSPKLLLALSGAARTVRAGTASLCTYKCSLGTGPLFKPMEMNLVCVSHMSCPVLPLFFCTGYHSLEFMRVYVNLLS